MAKLCTSCPLLKNDGDGMGHYCGLGYIIADAFFGATSTNCNLKKIIYDDPDTGKTVEFTPEEA